MVKKIFILSRRFSGIPTFFNHAMEDGIFELLKKANKGTSNDKDDNPADSIILRLFPD